MQQRWEHHIRMNEGFRSKGKQTPTNNGPPHNGRQRSPKKMALYGPLNMFLCGVLSTSNVFPP